MQVFGPVLQVLEILILGFLLVLLHIEFVHSLRPPPTEINYQASNKEW